MASVDLDPVPGTPIARPVYPDPDSWVTDDDIGSDDEDPELVTKPSVRNRVRNQVRNRVRNRVRNQEETR